MKRYRLDVAYPLLCPGAPKLQHGALLAAHIALVFNWVFPMVGILPVLGIALCGCFVMGLSFLKHSFIQPYLNVLMWRLALSAISFLSLMVYDQNTAGVLFEDKQHWVVVGILLASLSVYDTLDCIKGRLGLEIIKPFKDALERKK